VRDLEQQQQRALLDNIPDPAWLKDRDSRYLAVNPAYLAIIGLQEDEVIGKTPYDIWPSDLADIYMQTDRAVVKSGRRRRYEETRPDPDGQMLWFETIKSPIRDSSGHIIGTVGISRELHDELGQTLTAMKIELIWLRERLASQDVLQGRVDRLVSIVDRSVTDLRRIAVNLRPMILDELGLVAAMKWLTQNSAELGGLDISLSFDKESVSYDSAVSTAAFRIVQEALTNVMRHGEAKRASVAVFHEGQELHIEITDNGRGIDQSASQPNKLGLVGMRERARALGGAVAISDNPQGGTIVSVHLPLNDPPPQDRLPS
jgi:PAS domain S-box-containing protein